MKHYNGKGYCNRCDKKGCQRYVLPHSFHPVFKSGRRSTELRLQAAALFMKVAKVTQASSHLCLKLDHKLVNEIHVNCDAACARYVTAEEKKIRFGLTNEWPDVEADEVDLGFALEDPDEHEEKKPVKHQKVKEWEQWGGLVQRGFPQTLKLYRLKPNKTVKRVPGPGAMRKRDWKPIAKADIENKNVILHTDGARVYKMAVPGVVHDNVVHKKFISLLL